MSACSTGPSGNPRSPARRLTRQPGPEPRQSTFCVIELELQEGDPADLFLVAQALAETVPLRLSVKAKSAVGFALLDGKGPPVVKAETLDLPDGASVGDVFRRVARACLRHMRLNETAFLEGG